jgi:hypothetical protein
MEVHRLLQLRRKWVFEAHFGKILAIANGFSLDIYNYHKSYRNGGYIDGQNSYHR